MRETERAATVKTDKQFGETEGDTGEGFAEFPANREEERSTWHDSFIFGERSGRGYMGTSQDGYDPSLPRSKDPVKIYLRKMGSVGSAKSGTRDRHRQKD